MIVFDNFESWYAVEKEYIKSNKKPLKFKNNSWINDTNALSCAMFFYCTYFHFGRNFLLKKAEKLKIPKKKNVYALIEYLKPLHEIMMQHYDFNYLLPISDMRIIETIKDYIPLNTDAIKRYILSENSDLHVKAEVVAYMIVIWIYASQIGVLYKYFGIENLSYKLGGSFIKLYDFILHNNEPLYRHIAEVKYNISIALHSFGYFDNYTQDDDELEEDTFKKSDLRYIERNFYKVKELYELTNTSKIPWKYVKFLDGELVIPHPRHPDGEGKYKPFYYKTQKTKKAFNQIKDHIINKLPPIKAEFNDDDVIISIDDSSVARISECLDILRQHIEHTVCLENDNNNKTKSLKNKKDYSNQDIKEYIEDKKSTFLNTLSSLHLGEYKIYYCMESRVNTEMIKHEEDAFIFTLESKNGEVLLAYENTELNRATYLFTCDKSKTEAAIEKIGKFFSSVLVNKRERVYRILNDKNNSGLKRLFKVSHSDSNWEKEIKKIRDSVLG